MNTRILTRLSISVSLLFTLVACSDSTQFAEKTLPGALDAVKPAPEGDPSGTSPESEPSGEGTESPNSDVTNEDNPSGVKPDDSPPGDQNPDPGSVSPPVTGSGGSPTAGASGAGAGTGGNAGAGAGGSTPPPGEVFSECSANPNMAIVSQLYQLPPQTSKLPNFSTMNPIGDVCVAQLNIADRDFSQGFPGVSDIFEWFALDMRFKLQVTKAGTYQFFLNSDDGSILSINNAVVVDNDGTHSQIEKSGSAYLGIGVHDVRVRYYQGPRTRIALELFWKVPGTSNKVYVPTSAMSRP